jgi:hypothetical protein
MYFLATTVVTLLLIVSALTAFYDGPDGTADPDFGFGFENEIVQADAEQEDYNRNVSLILQVTSAGLFATAVLGLGSRFNPLRASLMLAGLLVYLVGVGFWAQSSDQWLGFVTTALNFAVLGAGFLWLEEGLPLEPKPQAPRIEIPPAGAAISSPSPPPPPPPPVPPPPQVIPEMPASPPADGPGGEANETASEED